LAGTGVTIDTVRGPGHTATDRTDRPRFSVVVEEGPPRGDLYELEQATTFYVVDAASGDVVMTFHGLMEATLSGDTGLWDDYRTTGVREVLIAPNDELAIVRYFDGREERVLLP
jgi:hypothetical protein